MRAYLASPRLEASAARREIRCVRAVADSLYHRIGVAQQAGNRARVHRLREPAIDAGFASPLLIAFGHPATERNDGRLLRQVQLPDAARDLECIEFRMVGGQQDHVGCRTCATVTASSPLRAS